ncbi:hypothetical protein [Tomitella gaofuii]|uniref:hypothetical protein n=1 Tax=Tomitella gaofuii TaxID=2760083 RepID=UPI0015FD5EED|nr:hypothetical protein [Tomitella gaofuii]
MTLDECRARIGLAVTYVGILQNHDRPCWIRRVHKSGVVVWFEDTRARDTVHPNDLTIR